MKIDKSKFKDGGGRYLTQSLFLEFQYDPTFAVFTFEGEDKEYNGKKYISLKKLYLEAEDPVEYKFARKYLFDWPHWQRMNENKALRIHFDQWREELEVLLRADAVEAIRDMSADGTNFQAMKWLADKGWDKRGAGRPSKAEVERNKRINEKIMGEFDEDFDRMNVVDMARSK